MDFDMQELADDHFVLVANDRELEKHIILSQMEN